MSEDQFLNTINKRIDEYVFITKALKTKMLVSLVEAVKGLNNEKDNEYKLRDKINEILDYHDTFDFGHNAIELLEQIKAIVIPPKES